MRRDWWMTLGIAAFAAAVASAQDGAIGHENALETPDTPGATRDWTVRGRALVWFPSLDGTVTFDNDPTFKIDDNLGLEDNEPTFLGDLLIENDRWLFWGDVFEFDTEARQPTPLGIFDSEYSMTSLGGRVGYDPFGPLLEPGNADLRFHLLGGVRGYNFQHRFIDRDDTISDFDEWTATAEGGARLALRLDPEFTDEGWIDVEVALVGGYGGFGSNDLGTIEVWMSVNYQIQENIGLTFGYRQIDWNLDGEDDRLDYESDGRIAGLFVGGLIRF